MTTSTPYAPARLARSSRAQVLRLTRRASRTEAIVRAAVLAAALATLVVGLNGALRSGSQQVAASLDAIASVR